MSSPGARPSVGPRSLRRLRLRLTAWYVGTFLLILLLLGVGMFAAITSRFDTDLDASLREATAQLAKAVNARGPQAGTEYLIVPDRQLYLFDSTGSGVGASVAAPWLAQFARHAFDSGGRTIGHRSDEERILRAHAVPFRLADGRRFVAVAVADEVELEDKYAALIAAFGSAALAALVLVAFGGWVVARQSTAPVERAVDHMRRFMADAAHELRTPLTVVRTRAEIALQRSRTPAEYEAALQGIERESARVGRIVEDLLILARADAGERPIERRRVFLDDVTLDAAEAARVMADLKSVRLEVADFEEAPVTGDSALLRQLVLILLDNAIKYTPAKGTVTVAVRAAGGHAQLIVSDTGIGIDADQLAHVFERFYRVDPSRTRGLPSASEGAGLGLAIAQWIAHEHRATIRVESHAGQGTRATVQFPADPDVVSSS